MINHEIIDFRVRLRTPELLKAWAPKPEPCFERYVELYRMKPRLTFQTVEETIEEMTKAGVTKAVLCGGNAQDNEIIAEIVKKYPGRFIGIAGVRPDREGVTVAYKQLRYALEVLNLKGVSIGPYLMNIYANHKKLYPLYVLCDDLGKIVIIHSSLHYNVHTPLDLGDPRFFDEIAVDLPNLKIVMSHAGVGFVPMPMVIAQRHKNVYLEVSALIPKYVNPMLLNAINTYLKDKVIFGTDYPLVPFDIADQWKEHIKPENHELFFYKNALRLLGEL